eukprot:scaffold438_cov250-Pinguiococcus_pyrenoidosus.AAC.34
MRPERLFGAEENAQCQEFQGEIPRRLRKLRLTHAVSAREFRPETAIFCRVSSGRDASGSGK